MKIIGSSRIDDHKKVAIEDAVLKAIDAKPGDSVLFYRKHNDDSVCVYRAEGAKITTEADAPRRRHMREAFNRIRLFLLLASVFVILRLVVTILNYDALGTARFAITITLGILTLIFLVACVYLSQIVDKPYDPQALVTIGNVYSKNRITGLSKVTTDGYVAQGNVYVNALFGANAVNVDATVVQEDGKEFFAVVNEIKNVPGYTVHKIHMKEETPSSGTLYVHCKYRYLGKTIMVTSEFQMDYDPKAKDINVTEGPVTATIEFDKTLNDTQFDEEWLKVEEDIY